MIQTSSSLFGKTPNNTISLLAGRRKISHIVPHTKNENVTTSGSYEHVKYHTFCIVRKSQISQILDRTKIQISQILPIMPNTRVIKSGICHCAAKWNDAIYALHGKVTYTKFYLARNRKISQICFVRKSQISQILPRTEVIKSGIVLIWQSRMTQILQKKKIAQFSFLYNNATKILYCVGK